MVVNALAPMQYVTGSEILNQGDLRAQLYNNMYLNTADVTGYYQNNPTLARELGMGNLALGQGNLALGRDSLTLQGELGRGELALGRDRLGLDRELGFGELALGRDQLNAAIAEAQRQFQLDTQRFGLETAQFNYDQRLGEATVRLEQLGLLSSLRGPADYLAYNYTLNNMAAPEGTAVDPFQMTAGLNQQYTAPPMAPVAQPAPTTQYDAAARANPSAPATGGGGGGSTAPTNAFAAQQQQVAPRVQYQPPVNPNSYGTSITGNAAHDAQMAANSWAGASPEIMAEYNRISQGMNQTYNNAMAQNPNFQLFAQGGSSPGGLAITGDDPTGQGRYTGNEELVISEGPFDVLSHEDTLATGALQGQEGAPAQGMPQENPSELVAMILQAFQWGQEGGPPQTQMQPPQGMPEGMPTPPAAAWGGSFAGFGGQDSGGQDWGQMLNGLMTANHSNLSTNQPTPQQGQQWQRSGGQSGRWQQGGQRGGRAGTGPGYGATQEWSNPYPQAAPAQPAGTAAPQQRQRGRHSEGPGQTLADQSYVDPYRNQHRAPAPVAPGAPPVPAPAPQQTLGQKWFPDWTPPTGGIAGFGPWFQAQLAQLGQLRGQVPHAATGGSFGSIADWRAQQGGSQQQSGGNQQGNTAGQGAFTSSMLPWAFQGGGSPSGGATIQPATPPAAGGAPVAGANNGSNPANGFFNFNVHGPQDTANAPFIQQALGNMESPGWNQRGAPLGPFGAQPFSYTNYLSMLPSAREMMRGYIETPAAMGGLGGDWMDELERSRRASATGVSFGPAQYQR